MTAPTDVTRKSTESNPAGQYDPRLERAPPRAERKWTSNEEILLTWQAFLKDNSYSRNVQVHYPTQVRVFMRTWGETLVTRLEDQDIQLFVDLIGKKCSNLLRRTSRSQCRAGIGVDGCPLLNGLAPEQFTQCPSYRPLDPLAVLSYLTSIQGMYQWLVEAGYMKYNPARPTMARFRRRHRTTIEKRNRSPRRRILKLEEVQRLIQGAPIRRAIVYALMAKCFLRIHEVMKLSLDPRYCDLSAGFFDLPPDQDYGDKRRGPNRIVIDAELRILLDQYLSWRERKIFRNADGSPASDKLVITNTGKPWGKNGFQGNFRIMMHKDCVRLGLMSGKETSREELVNTNCFRAFSSTVALDRGANSAQVQVLRGDKAQGTVGVYDDPRPRLAGLYRDFGPKVGISLDGIVTGKPEKPSATLTGRMFGPPLR